MRHPQIVVFESDSLLARQLQETATANAWLLRESRQTPACMKLLRAGGPAVLVLRVGRARRGLRGRDLGHSPSVPARVRSPNGSRRAFSPAVRGSARGGNGVLAPMCPARSALSVSGMSELEA